MELQILPKSLQNDLRTGVNIRTPTHCIVQLVLNSLDAKSTSVAVRVNLVTHSIQLIDNGTGIIKHNFKLIGQRYATNKYFKIGELKNKHFFGCRGEAIASIITMSKMFKIISRSANHTKTYCKIFENGKFTSFKSCSERASTGTTIIIENFMYNLPVRQKQMDNSMCLDEIKIELEHIALINPRTSFSLRDNVTGKTVFHTYKTKYIHQTLSHLYGKDFHKSLRKLKFTEDNITIIGFFSSDPQPNNKIQLVYINRRFVNKTKIHILINSLLAKSKILKSKDDNQQLKQLYCAFIIDITCPYSEIDIVDYTDIIIEFKDWDKILSLVEKAIQTFLQNANLIDISSPKNNFQDGSPISEDKPVIRASQVAGVIRGLTMKRKHEEDDFTKKNVIRSSQEKLIEPQEKRFCDISSKGKPSENNFEEKITKNVEEIKANNTDTFQHNFRNFLIKDKQNKTVEDIDCNRKIINSNNNDIQSIDHNQENGKKVMLDMFLKSTAVFPGTNDNHTITTCTFDTFSKITKTSLCLVSYSNEESEINSKSKKSLQHNQRVEEKTEQFKLNFKSMSKEISPYNSKEFSNINFFQFDQNSPELCTKIQDNNDIQLINNPCKCTCFKSSKQKLSYAQSSDFLKTKILKDQQTTESDKPDKIYFNSMVTSWYDIKNKHICAQISYDKRKKYCCNTAKEIPRKNTNDVTDEKEKHKFYKHSPLINIDINNSKMEINPLLYKQPELKKVKMSFNFRKDNTSVPIYDIRCNSKQRYHNNDTLINNDNMINEICEKYSKQITKETQNIQSKPINNINKSTKYNTKNVDHNNKIYLKEKSTLYLNNKNDNNLNKPVNNAKDRINNPFKFPEPLKPRKHKGFFIDKNKLKQKLPTKVNICFPFTVSTDLSSRSYITRKTFNSHSNREKTKTFNMDSSKLIAYKTKSGNLEMEEESSKKFTSFSSEHQQSEIENAIKILDENMMQSKSSNFQILNEKINTENENRIDVMPHETNTSVFDFMKNTNYVSNKIILNQKDCVNNEETVEMTPISLAEGTNTNYVNNKIILNQKDCVSNGETVEMTPISLAEGTEHKLIQDQSRSFRNISEIKTLNETVLHSNNNSTQQWIDQNLQFALENPVIMSDDLNIQNSSLSSNKTEKLIATSFLNDDNNVKNITCTQQSLMTEQFTVDIIDKKLTSKKSKYEVLKQHNSKQLKSIFGSSSPSLKSFFDTIRHYDRSQNYKKQKLPKRNTNDNIKNVKGKLIKHKNTSLNLKSKNITRKQNISLPNKIRNSLETSEIIIINNENINTDLITQNNNSSLNKKVNLNETIADNLNETSADNNNMVIFSSTPNKSGNKDLEVNKPQMIKPTRAAKSFNSIFLDAVNESLNLKNNTTNEQNLILNQEYNDEILKQSSKIEDSVLNIDKSKTFSEFEWQKFSTTNEDMNPLNSKTEKNDDKFHEKSSNLVIDTDKTDYTSEIEWEKRVTNSGNRYYLNCRTGMTSFQSPKNLEEYSMTKRFDFMPKGSSPIFKKSTSIRKELSPNSKTLLFETMTSCETDELRTVKWMKYLQDKDIDSFFASLYSDKKYFETDIPSIQKDAIPKKLTTGFQNEFFTKTMLENVVFLKQWDNKFLVTNMQEKCIALFDQHAVHERIRFEHLLKKYKNKNGQIKSFKCIKPITLTVDEFVTKMLRNYKNSFENWGFSYEINAENAVTFSYIPSCWQSKSCNHNQEFIESLIVSLIEEESSWLRNVKQINVALPLIIMNSIKMEACRSAIKFGDSLTEEQCKHLLKKLSLCDLPFQCAHGRPTVVPLFYLSNSKTTDSESKINFKNIKNYIRH